MEQPTTKQLRRSSTDKVLGGVSGGLANYFGMDANIIRILWVLFLFIGTGGGLVYTIMWWLIPNEMGNRTNTPLILLLVLWVLPIVCSVCFLMLGGGVAMLDS